MVKMTDKERSLANVINEGFLDSMKAKPSREYQDSEYKNFSYQKSDRIEAGHLVTTTRMMDTKAFDSSDSNYTSQSTSDSAVGAQAAARVMLKHPYRYQEMLDVAKKVQDQHPEFSTAPVRRKTVAKKSPIAQAVEPKAPVKRKSSAKKNLSKPVVESEEPLPPYPYASESEPEYQEGDHSFAEALADLSSQVLTEVGKAYYETHKDEIDAKAKAILANAKGKITNTGYAMKHILRGIRLHRRK